MTDNGDERELPEGWKWLTVADIGEVVAGGTPSTKEPANWGGGVAWVTPADLSGYGAKLISEGERSITETGLKSSSAIVMPAGSVLFSSRAPIGYVAIAAKPLATNQGFKSIVPHQGVLSDYLYHYLKGSKDLAESYASGTTFKELSAKRFKQLPVPLAPLAEQRRIVDAIEELFSDLDAGVKALETVRRQLDRYRQSVLKAAVEGDLTREWREQHGAAAEPADALLERILDERRTRWEIDYAAKYEAKGKTPPKGWQSRYKEPEPPDTADLPELPDGWVWANVDQLLAQDLSNGRSVKTREGGFPVLRLTAIQNGAINLDEHKPGAWTAEEAEPYRVKPGDFLLSRGNGSLDLVGRGGLVGKSEFRAAYPDTMIRLDVNNEAYLPQMLRYVWDSYHVREQVTSSARTTAGIYKINQQHVRDVTLPLPSLAEQEAIVEEVERRLSVVDAVAAEVDRQLARAGRLRRSILQHAFEGKLVPQEFVEGREQNGNPDTDDQTVTAAGQIELSL